MLRTWRCGFDSCRARQLETVNPGHGFLDVYKISHSETMIVNIIDKDVAGVCGAVHTQVYMHTAVGSKEVTLLHRVFILRGWYSGCAVAFQASETGSIPVPRSNFASLAQR